MGVQHPFFKIRRVERAGLPTGLTLDQGGAGRFNLSAAFLFSPDQVADILTVVGLVPSHDLSFDPVVLLIS